MKTVSATDAKQRLAALLDVAQREPVLIRRQNRDVAVIIPELVGTRWYHYVLHNQTAAVMVAYLRLSGYRRVVVVSVPWYLSS